MKACCCPSISNHEGRLRRSGGQVHDRSCRTNHATVPLIPLVRHHRHHSDKGVIVLGILKDVLTVDATQHDVVDTRSA